MSELITALAVVFIAAGVLLLVANHLSLSPVPFYILAGLITGQIVEQPEIIELAQWGIAFLVFVFGFRVNLGDLQAVIRDSEVAAFTQIIVVGPIAFGVGLLFGFDTLNAVYFSIAALLSSTLVGAGLLEKEIRDNLVHGRLAQSVHFFDDILAIGLVLVLSAEVFTSTHITSKIGYGVFFLVGALLIYRHGYPILIRLADGSDELVMMGSISILIGFLAAAEFAGISIVVGAFAAGIAIRSDGQVSIDVLNGIESIRDFFVAIFFVTVGALVSVPTTSVFVTALALTVLVVIVNPFVITLAFTLEGYDPRTAFLTSTSLNQVSEFALIIAIQASIAGTISETMFDAIILAAAVTMILTSLTRRHEEDLYRLLGSGWVDRRQRQRVDARSQVGNLEDHVLIVGYGRFGRRLAEVCETAGRDYVVIENDPVVWETVTDDCDHYVLGDAMATYPWQKAQIEDAEIAISTIDQKRVTDQLLSLTGATDADLVPRAGSSTQANEWFNRGATYVIVPNILASDQLLELVDQHLTGDRSARSIREAHLERLERLESQGLTTRLND